MKGIYGYVVTMVGLVLSVVITLIMSDDNAALSNNSFSMFMLMVVISGFLGGFIAPYHIMRNSRNAALTVIIGVLIPLLLLAQVTGEVDLESTDFGGALILIILFVILLVLIIGTIIALVLLIISGFVGSLVGRLVFKREQYDDFQPEYMQSYSQDDNG